MPGYSKHCCANALIEFKLHECLIGGAKQPNSAANELNERQWQSKGNSGSDCAESKKIYENKSRWDLVTSTIGCSITQRQVFDTVGRKTGTLNAYGMQGSLRRWKLHVLSDTIWRSLSAESHADTPRDFVRTSARCLSVSMYSAFMSGSLKASQVEATLILWSLLKCRNLGNDGESSLTVLVTVQHNLRNDELLANFEQQNCLSEKWCRKRYKLHLCCWPGYSTLPFTTPQN